MVLTNVGKRSDFALTQHIKTIITLVLHALGYVASVVVYLCDVPILSLKLRHVCNSCACVMVVVGRGGELVGGRALHVHWFYDTHHCVYIAGKAKRRWNRCSITHQH